MYRNGSDYDRTAQLVIDIYIDYNITSFPVDEKELCRKLGLKLVPYSAYPEESQELLRKANLERVMGGRISETENSEIYKKYKKYLKEYGL